MISTKILKQFSSIKRTTVDSLHRSVIDAQYAVRGAVPIRAGQIKQEIKSGSKKYNFTDVTECNIGNPLIFGQQPVSFNRDVLAATLSPRLLEKINNPDVTKRVQGYLDQIPGNFGGYSDSLGFSFARQSVSDFIKRRDGLTTGPDINNIFLLDGASQGVHMALKMLIRDPREGVMIPIPQYPLYTAAIALYEGQEVHYYLNEEKGWSVTIEDLEQQYQDAVRHGLKPKVIVVINPGNPTGQVMSAETIEQIIKFSAEKGLIIFADEVYQNNIYTDSKKFVSFNQVRSKLTGIYNQVELYSFHSTSKGLLGECGLRGGYLHIENVDEKVRAELVKLKSINLCSNVIGQIATDLMVNPPTLQTASQSTVSQLDGELSALHKSLKLRAEIVGGILKTFDHVTCNEVEGAMYAFPQLQLPKKYIEEARRQGKEPDLVYCLDLLNETGICVPGSGFGQKKDTYHLRITTLILPEEHLKNKMEEFRRFNTNLHKKWA